MQMKTGFWSALMSMGLVFIVLKITGVIAWPWAWVVFPIALMIGLPMMALLVLALIALFVGN